MELKPEVLQLMEQRPAAKVWRHWRRHEFPFSWTPASEYAFDAGVAVIGVAAAVCSGVADED